MQYKTKVFTAIAVPVVILLIGAVVVIAISLETCDSGKLCVALNSDNETVNDKVYDGGVHVISPAWHFSNGLPAFNHSIVGGVQTASEKIILYNESGDITYTELGVFVVFKFYVEEKNVFKFFEAMPNGFLSDEYDFSSMVAKNATPVVTDILSSFNCTEYKDHQEEEYWIKKYGIELEKRFKEHDFLFTLDNYTPVKAVFLFDGCGHSA